jgi:hypothetical protein
MKRQTSTDLAHLTSVSGTPKPASNETYPEQAPPHSAPRCAYLSPSGRHCAFPVSGKRSALCFRHLAMQKKKEDGDLAAALTADSGGFQSAEAINHSLGELYTLLAQNRVSPRRAAVLAYISSLLLRTVAALDPKHEDFSAMIEELSRPTLQSSGTAISPSLPDR